MIRHLGIFSTLLDIQTALNDNLLGNPYVAISGEVDSRSVDYNTLENQNYSKYTFAGFEIAAGPLYYNGENYEIKDSWNYDSYNSIYGKNEGSYYFTFQQMGQLFEKSTFSSSNGGDIENKLDPLNGWRLPSDQDWINIICCSTDTPLRNGSNVNGVNHVIYALIQLTNVTHAGSSTPDGMLLFPDGKIITGKQLNGNNLIKTTEVTESELQNYLNQGCIFLPASGYYSSSWTKSYNYYWSSKSRVYSNKYYAYVLDIKNATITGNIYQTYYLPVRCIKEASIDIKSKFLNLNTNNGINYSSVEAQIQKHGAEGYYYSLTNVEITGLTQEIKTYISNGNHDKWYHLNTPIHFINTDNSDHIGIWKQDTYINAIKYDDNTNILYLSSNRYIWNDISILTGSSNNEDEINRVFGTFGGWNNYASNNYYNGYKIYYDKSKDIIYLGPVEMTLVESYDIYNYTSNVNEHIIPLVYSYEESDGNTAEYDLDIHFMPSVIINKIEEYHNNEWNGNSINIENSNIYLYNNYNKSLYPYTEDTYIEEDNQYVWDPSYISSKFVSMEVDGTNNYLVLTDNSNTIWIDLITLKISLSEPQSISQE